MSAVQGAWLSARRIGHRLARLSTARRGTFAADSVNFECNICGGRCMVDRARLTREEPTCGQCGSTVRMRSVIRTLAVELLGRNIALPQFPVRKDLRGIGLSDWEVYAREFARVFDYTNTFYDVEPRLDIKHVDRSLYKTADFLIATDVFEHVAPPIAPAFENAKAVLKDGGLLVFSVPFALEDEQTLEHFPDLYEFQIVEHDGVRTLLNRTHDGKVTEYTDLIFHGGNGLTLEMRLFTRTSLLAELRRAGFEDIVFHGESDPPHGIFWGGDYSLVLSARA